MSEHPLASGFRQALAQCDALGEATLDAYIAQHPEVAHRRDEELRELRASLRRRGLNFLIAKWALNGEDLPDELRAIYESGDADG